MECRGFLRRKILAILDAISSYMVLEITVKKSLLLDRVLLKKTGVVSLVTGELVVFIGGGYWLGSSLDLRWQTAPIFTLILALLGLAYAGWRISRLAKEWMK